MIKTNFNRYTSFLLYGLGIGGLREINLHKLVSYMIGDGQVKPTEAYELAKMANNKTANPLNNEEFDATFENCLKEQGLI